MLSDDDLVDSLKKEKMSISTMQDDGLDERGKAAAKKLIKELKETIDDDGLPVSERTAAQNEYERLMKILSTQYGNKPLNLHAPQKVNKSVKDDLDRAGKAIRRAFNRINKESPELAEYLKKTIKTGTQYNFTDIGTPWHISI
jgi:phosphomevalonate kinase